MEFDDWKVVGTWADGSPRLYVLHGVGEVFEYTAGTWMAHEPSGWTRAEYYSTAAGAQAELYRVAGFKVAA